MSLKPNAWPLLATVALSMALLANLGLTRVACAQDETEDPATQPADEPTDEHAAEEAAQSFDEGRRLFFQGKFEEALPFLQEAVEKNEERTSYRLLLAKAYRYADKLDESREVLEGILEDDPSHVESAVALAEILTPQESPQRVIEVLEPLLRFNHDYPLYHLLAEAHYEIEDLAQARLYFEEATRLNPRNPDDHYQLGNIYLAQQRFARAATAYERAAALGYSSGVFHFKLASAYFNLHHYLGSVQTAQIVGGVAGQISNEWYLLDEVPLQPDTFYVVPERSAIYQAVKAREMGIDMVELRFLEANSWLGARRYARADALYAEIEGEVPEADTGLFWYYWSQVALGLGEFDHYLQRLENAIQAEPEVYDGVMTDAYVTVANRYQQQGDSSAYLEYLGKAVDSNPLSSSLHLQLGDAFWLAGEPDSARKEYQLVLELEPDHADRARLLTRIQGR